MGIRETLNENPRLTTGITAGIIIVVFAMIFWSSGGSAGPGDGGAGTKVYFTDDDGKNTFPDDAKKIPPFQRNGKEAVRARVFKCGGKTFVNHLERYTPEGKKKAEEFFGSGKMSKDPTMLESIQRGGMEVKAPGDAAWVKVGDPKAIKIMEPKCPTGATDLEEIKP